MERGFDAAGDHVLTHRDVEPWNVLLGAAGPVLVDWDGAGPDSAGLELAHAALAFAGRDGAAVRRVLDAYAARGGTLPEPGPAALARRVGIRLGRLAGRLRLSVGELPPGPDDPAALDRTAAARIAGITAFVDEMVACSELLRGPGSRADRLPGPASAGGAGGAAEPDARRRR